MHCFEGHHFASRLVPYFLVGEAGDHGGDSAEVVGLPIEILGFPAPEKDKFPFRKGGGAKATQNGNHNSVHV